MQGRKIAGAVIVAGLLAGGAASMASNTFSNSTNVAGYGEDTASGATVTGISYGSWAGDPSKIASVTFTTSTDVNGLSADLTLKDAGGAAAGAGQYNCDTSGTYTAGSMTITCSTTDHPDYASVVSTGLAVHQ